MDFQTIILKLQKFWAGQNCIMAQPYDIERHYEPVYLFTRTRT